MIAQRQQFTIWYTYDSIENPYKFIPHLRSRRLFFSSPEEASQSHRLHAGCCSSPELLFFANLASFNRLTPGSSRVVLLSILRIVSSKDDQWRKWDSATIFPFILHPSSFMWPWGVRRFRELDLASSRRPLFSPYSSSTEVLLHLTGSGHAGQLSQEPAPGGEWAAQFKQVPSRRRTSTYVFQSANSATQLRGFDNEPCSAHTRVIRK